MKKIILLLLSLLVLGCGNEPAVKKNSSAPKKVIEVPSFNSDSAYDFVAKQVAFGSRVPNSKAHKACGEYLINTLNRYCDTVIVQKADLTAFDGNVLKSKNIIASFKPERAKRVMLCAHWDTRPFADQAETNEVSFGEQTLLTFQ